MKEHWTDNLLLLEMRCYIRKKAMEHDRSDKTSRILEINSANLISGNHEGLCNGRFEGIRGWNNVESERAAC